MRIRDFGWFKQTDTAIKCLEEDSSRRRDHIGEIQRGNETDKKLIEKNFEKMENLLQDCGLIERVSTLYGICFANNSIPVLNFKLEARRISNRLDALIDHLGLKAEYVRTDTEDENLRLVKKGAK